MSNSAPKGTTSSPDSEINKRYTMEHIIDSKRGKRQGEEKKRESGGGKRERRMDEEVKARAKKTESELQYRLPATVAHATHDHWHMYPMET